MFQSVSIISLYYNLIVSVFRNTRNGAWYFHLFQILFQFCFYAARARHLPLSLMNRLNQTESAVFELWFLFFKESLFFFFHFKLLTEINLFLIYIILAFQYSLVFWEEVLQRFYVPSNSILITLGQWKGEHEMLCAMKHRLG